MLRTGLLRALSFVAAFALGALSSATAAAQQYTVLVDSDHRPATSLDGAWHTIVDPYHAGWGKWLVDTPAKDRKPRPNGYQMNAEPKGDWTLQEYSFAASPVLQVPGDWNSQRESLLLYEGLVWYEKDFDYQPKPGNRTFLHIGAANYEAHVFVNQADVCDHEGGFTPFDCEVTHQLKPGNNFVVIAVDNERRAGGVPTLNTDWWNYGGLTRDVSLIDVPEQFVDDYSLQLRRGSANLIEGYVHVVDAAPGARVTVSIPELRLEKTAQTDADGNARFSFAAPGLALWSPTTPKLYRVQLSAGRDTLSDDIGFRTIETRGDQILLNGEPVFLRGVNIHAEAPYRSGRAWSEQDAETLLGWTKELDADFVRLAHYPHDERMTRLADRLGIMVWSEIPVYWAIDWTSKETLANAQQQLHDMIRRDHNKASVILWSVSNETQKSPERLAFLTELVHEARTQDPTRLITSAMLSHTEGKTVILDDPLGKELDVLGNNEYIGWYTATPNDAPEYTFTDPFNKPLIMSEFGGAAKAGFHSDTKTRFTEEAQAHIYEEQLEMLKKIPFLAGMTPWLLMDFRSPVRQLPGFQDGYNRKGLISNLGQKKLAFEVLKKFYESDPKPPER